MGHGHKILARANTLKAIKFEEVLGYPSSWIEHKTRKKKKKKEIFVSQSKTNSFQPLVHKMVTVSKPRWET